MQKNKSKKTVSIKDIKLEYLSGKPVDEKTFKNALGFLGTLLVMALAYLLIGSAMVMDNIILRSILNMAVLLIALMMFYSNGASKGENAANNGEMMFDRQRTGAQVNPKDQASCFHPAKGFIIALLGSIPVVLCAAVLAVVAQRQMTGLGALPSWISTFEERAEIGNALLFYHQNLSLTVQDVLRVIVRMLMMPVVNVVSYYGADALLALEHVSPLLMILPALSYGIGYTQGVNLRKQVHVGIAEGEAKRKKKEKRQRKMQQQRQRAPKGPEQLN